MTDKEQPKEPEKTVHERDKTAKGPEIESPSKPPRPVIKPRKVFVPKKIKAKKDVPMEHRVRHILVSSLEAADLFRQSILDFQKELAEEPMDDPDKEFNDREKLENFFGRIAKKYSTCLTKPVGGDLGWFYKGMGAPETATKELVDEFMKLEKFVIPEPVKTKLGHHIVMVCETRALKHKKAEDGEDGIDPRYKALADQDRPKAQAPTRKDIPT